MGAGQVLGPAHKTHLSRVLQLTPATKSRYRHSPAPGEALGHKGFPTLPVATEMQVQSLAQCNGLKDLELPHPWHRIQSLPWVWPKNVGDYYYDIWMVKDKYNLK